MSRQYKEFRGEVFAHHRNHGYGVYSPCDIPTPKRCIRDMSDVFDEIDRHYEAMGMKIKTEEEKRQERIGRWRNR